LEFRIILNFKKVEKTFVNFMIVERIKNIILKPRSEWDVITQEPITIKGFYFNYIAPLAAIPVLATIIGTSFIGTAMPFMGRITTPFQLSLVTGLISYIATLIGVYIAALVISALAPTFSGVKDNSQALKLVAYSMTPGWLAGILYILPNLGFIALLASLYGIYLLYLGLPKLMKSPKEKTIGYIIVSFVVLAVIQGVIGAIVGVLSVSLGMFLVGSLGF
jgi:hypothetical protein